LPTPHAYATVLRAYAQPIVGAASARLVLGKEVWAEMERKRVAPNEATFAGMIECAVSCGDTMTASKLMAEMKEKKMHPTATVFATLIRGLVMNKEMTKAMELYQDMRKQDLPLGLVTYNAMVDACARVGDVDRAAVLFRDMCANGIVPDLVTYSTVIKGYCVHGDLEQAIQLFTLMRKRGLQPDQILFNSILDGCAKKPMRSLAEQVVNDMETCGVPLTNYTLSILVKLYSRCADPDAALRITEEMSAKYRIELNVPVLTCLVQTLLTHGRCQEASEVFAKMKNPDSKAFQAFTRGLIRHNKVAEAVHMIERGLQSGANLEQQLINDISQVADRRRVPVGPLIKSRQRKY